MTASALARSRCQQAAAAWSNPPYSVQLCLLAARTDLRVDLRSVLIVYLRSDLIFDEIRSVLIVDEISHDSR